MKKQLLFVGLSALLVISGCGSSSGKPGPVSNLPDVKDETVELRISAKHNADYTMKFPAAGQKGKAFTGPDGVTYEGNSFKPVWRELQSRLKITINDVTPATGDANSSFEGYWELKGFEGVDILNGNSANFNRLGTTTGQFIALDNYWDHLPNLKKLIDDNDVIRQSISSADGHIYFAPYFDGYNSIERMPMMRKDWVAKLLDGADPFAAHASDTDVYPASEYTRMMPEAIDTTIKVLNSEQTGTTNATKKYVAGGNIIDKMNADPNTSGGRTAAKWTQMLRDYIDATYNGFYGNNRSDLFVGPTAAYDCDEMVALLRVVRLNSNLLSGEAFNPSVYKETATSNNETTGESKDGGTGVIPFFTRESSNDRSLDMLRWAGTMWGARGLESRNGYLYADKDGNLHDARLENQTYVAVENLHKLYKEKLIIQDFDLGRKGTSSRVDYRAAFLGKKNRGFMTYDYNQTTTAFNAETYDAVKAQEDFHFTPVLNPVWNWEGGNNYFQFSESIRSVKPNAWGINAALQAKKGDNHKRLAKALALIDYQFSPAGHKLMSFGPDTWHETETITFEGQQIPKLKLIGQVSGVTGDVNLFKDGTNGAGGNYTNFLRGWLGATFPIGYIKNQGVEFQLTDPKGQAGEAMIANAIKFGTMKVLKPTIGAGETPFYSLIPTTMPLEQAEQDRLTNGKLADLTAAFRDTSSTFDHLYWRYVRLGYGVTGSSEIQTTLASRAALLTHLKDNLDLEVFLSIQKIGYERALAL